MEFKVIGLDDIEEDVIVEKKSNPYMTKMEFTKLVATRAFHLKNGAPSSIHRTADMHPADIAEVEIRRGIAPLAVKRRFPDGSYEVWRIKDLMIKSNYI